MRKLAIVITAALPAGMVALGALPATAEQVVLRIEAKRAAQSGAAAESWAGKFPNVVTFPLAGGWTGIALGPMERPAAEAELARLKAAGAIPGDSFVAPAPAATTPVAGAGAAADSAADSAPPANAPPQPAADAGATSTPGPTPPESQPQTPPEAADAAQPDPQATPDRAPQQAGQPAPGDYLRLQRFETRDAADEALTRWRTDFPEAGLFQQPDGGFAIALGPMAADTAGAWLGAFRKAERVGKPGAVLPAAELGSVLAPAAAISLPGPGNAEMPPLIEVQRALRWAGHYDGRIDGKDGAQTQAAIAAEVIGLRAAPDAPTAMRALIDRRMAWRDQMALTRLDDPQSGLSVTAPMDRLQFDRNDHGLSIYGPKDGSGAALILYSAPGGQQEMLDFTGLVTALGWVPSPERQIATGRASLKGRSDTHIGQADARVVDGRVEGVVLIWPVADETDQPRIAAELIDSLSRSPAPVASAPAASAPAENAPAEGAPPAN